MRLCSAVSHASSEQAFRAASADPSLRSGFRNLDPVVAMKL